MLNITLVSLSMHSMAISPLFIIPNNQYKIKMLLYNSQISRSFSNIIYSSTKNHQTIISNSFFLQTLSSSLRFVSDEGSNCFLDSSFEYQPNVPVGGQTFRNTRPLFTQNCGNITITGCQFIECKSTDKNSGGAICIMQESYVTIHNSIFDNCNSDSQKGGACLIVQTLTDNGINFNDVKTKEMDVQYCCFQNCPGSSSMYGICILSAAEFTRLYYASSVNCPGQNGLKVQVAQFKKVHYFQFYWFIQKVDLQADDIYSHDVNATGAHATHCGGIEYRYATKGYFKYQTISYMSSMFSVAYTDISTENLKLELSNIHHVTLVFQKTGDGRDHVYSGLIHVRYKNVQTQNDINIYNFCFVDNTFSTDSGDFSTIISKGTTNNEPSNYKVNLIECYYDVGNDKVAHNNVDTQNCVANTWTMNNIEQLDLGECKGKITAAPLTPTPSPSSDFSDSFDFTNSMEFTKTDPFSFTNKFSSSKVFTKSNEYTSSDFFTNSKEYTNSNVFTKSKEYTNSNVFTNSKEYTSSNVFSNSNFFGIPDPESNEKTKMSPGKIAGIACGVVAAIVIIALVAFFLIKKKRSMINEEDVETLDGTTSSINSANPIYNKEAEDDPFKEDFEGK